ncbi:hypothetical protein F2Q70_00000692 [Brassica cretica]|uniref:Uncharacterized protein n=1 Tax=Brassica cretica TaxID=69181 RepID=A0A8S9IW12_BRACR|nr:hypothetical protein F2Q68_00019083 [Brassica cretica]KAF2573652.1 hypothetical protein F2Q70_00000692 [Brassica cretica]
MVCCTWSWKQTLYVIIMHTFILSSCIAAFLYIKLNKIPLDRYQYIPGLFILFFYINTACAAVVIPPDRDPDSDSDSSDLPYEREPLGLDFFLAECLSHGFGLAFLVFLLYIISPKLALCAGIPAAVYFIAATVCVCRLPPDDLQSNQSRLPL